MAESVNALEYLKSRTQVDVDSLDIRGKSLLLTQAYHDPDPIFDIIVNAQRYYEQHSITTRVKACAAVNVEQILKLAGVHAVTASGDQLRELASMKEPAAKITQRSLFPKDLSGETAHSNTNGLMNGNSVEQTNGNTNGHTDETNNGYTNGNTDKPMEKLSFIDDESAFRLAFARADEGKAQLKTAQVRISTLVFIFSSLRCLKSIQSADLKSA
ncbi:MAG: hypothetical protein Q9209_001502 [Squamulea sp. 1 TL-2023]